MSTPSWIMWLMATSTCAVASVTDLAFGRIPNILTLPAALLAVLVHGLSPANSHAEHTSSGLTFSLLGMVGGFVVMLLIALVARGGGGDVKLAAALGAMLGLREVISVVGATCLIAVVGSCVLILLRPGARGEERKLTSPSGDDQNSGAGSCDAPSGPTKVLLGPYFLVAVLFLAFRGTA